MKTRRLRQRPENGRSGVNLGCFFGFCASQFTESASGSGSERSNHLTTAACLSSSSYQPTKGWDRWRDVQIRGIKNAMENFSETNEEGAQVEWF
jgi:hypothetical protein